MLFKVDENLPHEICELLKDAGHSAMTVAQQKMTGFSDQKISQVCIQENRILITLDTDFSDIRAYPPKKFPGFIVLRTPNQSRKNVTDLFKKVLPFLKIETVSKKLWIVEWHRIRIRGDE